LLGQVYKAHSDKYLVCCGKKLYKCGARGVLKIKGDGILYGKANNGKDTTPLYKLALMNFHNPQELFEYKQGQYLETEYSGKPVIGKGEVRSGLIELSNIDFKANATYWQEAQTQLDLSGKIMSTYKQLLQSAMELLS